jgi:hypothetical protein
MVDVITQLNSNQRLLRSQRRSPNLQTNTFNSTVGLPSRFISDSQDQTINFLSPTAYSLVNQNLANYTTDAFVYSQLSDLNYRTDPSSSSSSSTTNYHTIRMNPYARQTFYPMYTQREIHSPSSSSYNS